MQAASANNERGQSGPASSDQNENAAKGPPKLIPRPLEPAPSPTPAYEPSYPEPPVTPPVSGSILDADLSLHPTLRSPGNYDPSPNMMPAGITPEHQGVIPGPANPPLAAPMSSDSAGKAKRELSQSKRAAQNRAAQRAFRARKENYIKKLELEKEEYKQMADQFKLIQGENYALREYSAHLHSRLIEAGIEPPPPPPNLSLAEPVMAQPAHGLPEPVALAQAEAMDQDEDTGVPSEPTPNTGSATGAATLDAVAQAVQSLSQSDPAFKRAASNPDENQAAEDARTAEEISRQLSQAESAPATDM